MTYPMRGGGGVETVRPGGGWHVLVVRAEGEAAASRWLEGCGVMTWYPQVERWRRLPGGQRRVACLRPLMPGYLLARFNREPDWSALFDAEPGCFWLRGVLGRDARPAVLSAGDLRELSRMADRVAALWRAPEPEVVRPGDRVRVRQGGLEGRVLPVERVDGPLAWVLVHMLGAQRSVSVPVSGLDRVTL